MEDAIDIALVLLVDKTAQQDAEDTPEYLAWIEQTRLKIEAGVRAAERGDILDADEVIDRLCRKVEAARATSA